MSDLDRLRENAESPPVPRRIGEPGCTNPKAGRRLIPYSLGRLTAEQEFDFEVHLIECDHCFEALRGLDQIEAILQACVDFGAVEPA